MNKTSKEFLKILTYFFENGNDNGIKYEKLRGNFHEIKDTDFKDRWTALIVLELIEQSPHFKISQKGIDLMHKLNIEKTISQERQEKMEFHQYIQLILAVWGGVASVYYILEILKYAHLLGCYGRGF